MSATSEGPWSRRSVKISALGLVVILGVGAFVVLYPSLLLPPGPGVTITFPPTTKSTSRSTVTTGTGSHATPAVQIKSALIFNDTLSLHVKNVGTVWTRSLSVTGVCAPTPDLICFNYKGLSGRTITRVFVLAPQGEYVMNISGICVVPVSGCNHFYPVVNYTYYLTVAFTFSSGVTSNSAIAVLANNTYAPRTAVYGLQYQLFSFPQNGSGRLNTFILMNETLESANFIGQMYSESGRGLFTTRLLYNRTSCSLEGFVDCSSGNLTLTVGFSSVESGIGTPFFPPPYLLTVRDLTVRTATYFAIWVNTVNH